MSYGSVSFGVAFASNIVGMLITYTLYMYISAILLNRGSRKRMVLLAVPFIVISAAIGAVLYKSGSFRISTPLVQILNTYYFMAVLTFCIRFIYHEHWQSCVITAAVAVFLSDATENLSTIFIYKQFLMSDPFDFIIYTLITRVGMPLILLAFTSLLKRLDIRRVYNYWTHNERLRTLTTILALFVPKTIRKYHIKHRLAPLPKLP